MAQTNDPDDLDCSDCWPDQNGTHSADIAETLKARAARPAAAPTVHIQTMQGDIINLGSLPPEAMREFFAARRRGS